jgi:TATA-box binding protein (TBP) (component of TFIID and TFIIIB)
MNINDEWEKFKNLKHDNEESDEEDDTNDDDDDNYLKNYNNYNDSEKTNLNASELVPKATSIYVSTKTKIAYLNQFVDLKTIFWLIPVIPYALPSNGVIKKQIKLNSLCIEELNIIKEKLTRETYYEEYVMTNIDNPNGRIKFKDIRKVTIGISKKDIMSYRCKRKSAFYNCFVLIFRLKVEDTFKEFHVKIFNTGKIEIPGIQKEENFQTVLKMIIETLQPHFDEKLDYKPDSDETVLINSNFNCGFFINREILYDILKIKYNIQCIYDPCSYPGIQSKFYYNPDIGIQTGTQISEENKDLYLNVKEISFMIFRTGSVLIVGKCDENVLYIIYEFLKIILTNEYNKICQKNMNQPNNGNNLVKDKKNKIRKKNITVNVITP